MKNQREKQPDKENRQKKNTHPASPFSPGTVTAVGIIRAPADCNHSLTLCCRNPARKKINPASDRGEEYG
ncbi:MAG: hypothetical protein GY737_16490 [Desulfobacteraceae bacterium]|nr:hypothetical protein [Desulfobacteraceae bacterium]